jgi:hypothetical protein
MVKCCKYYKENAKLGFRGFFYILFSEPDIIRTVIRHPQMIRTMPNQKQLPPMTTFLRFGIHIVVEARMSPADKISVFRKHRSGKRMIPAAT